MTNNFVSRNYNDITEEKLKKAFGNNFTDLVNLYRYKISVEENKNIDGVKDDDVLEKMSSYGIVVNTSTFNRWKNGQMFPKIENLFKIALFFGCTVDELLIGKKENKSTKLRDRKREINKISKMQSIRPRALFGNDEEKPIITFNELSIGKFWCILYTIRR